VPEARYSSVRKALDFQPHDWDRVNESGADENLIEHVPRAEAHVMEK
jgi:hypothetical protein